MKDIESKRNQLKMESWIANVKRIYAIGDVEALMMYKKIHPDQIVIEKTLSNDNNPKTI